MSHISGEAWLSSLPNRSIPSEVGFYGGRNGLRLKAVTLIVFMATPIFFYSIAAFSIERYVVVCHPLLAQKICTVERANKILSMIWLFSVVYCAPWLGLTKTNLHPIFPQLETCEFRVSRRVYKVLFIFDFLLFYVIPLMAASIFFVKITSVLRARNRRMLIENPSVDIRRFAISLNSSFSHSTKRSTSISRLSSKRRQSHWRRDSVEAARAQVRKIRTITESYDLFPAGTRPQPFLLVCGPPSENQQSRKIS